MKYSLIISSILSWVNIAIAGLFVVTALFSILFLQALPMFIVVIFFGCIVLHSYAAMQLNKSIRNPEIPLGSQTPTGLKLMGYFSMFLAILWFSAFTSVLQHPQDFIKQVQMPKEMANFDLASTIRGMSIFMIIFSLSILVNVILNLRMLRWYKDNTQKPD
jgi:hypothetical protein